MRPSVLLLVAAHTCLSFSQIAAQEIAKPEGTVRFATFNVSLNRPTAGELTRELERGSSRQAKKIAEIIQRVRPDVILLNEIDYDGGKSVRVFQDQYLAKSQNGSAPIDYPHRFVAPVNTGVDSGVDLDGNGTPGQNGDAFGFGAHPGQYGLAILSRFPIDGDNLRSFQKFLWKDMPDARWPQNPNAPFYSDQAIKIFRLSSKTHLDLPIHIEGRTVHFVCAHPTPPVFDGPEDRNGRRNHDEIRMIADYVNGGSVASYLYDDRGEQGGLDAGEAFVIAGDMNADPADGDSFDNAIKLLLDHHRINSSEVPTSRGASQASRIGGGANQTHRGDPAADTADFNDELPGNLRVDYVLPSNDLKPAGSGVFWPAEGQPGSELVGASDHRLVWLDIQR